MLWQTTEGSFGSVSHLFWGVLFSGFFIFYFETENLKELRFFFLTGEEETEKKEYLFCSTCLHCVLTEH